MATSSYLTRGRVLIVSSEFPPGPGGIGTHAYQLAHNLSKYGWEVKVLAPQAYVVEEERVLFNGRQSFAVTTLPQRGTGLGSWGQRVSVIADSVRTFRPHVIVASGRRAIWIAALMHIRYAVPWIAVGHGSEFLGQSAPTQFLTSQVLRRATAVVAVSRYTAELIRQVVTPKRMVVIPNGADGSRFSPAPPDPDLVTRLGLTGKQVLLTVGHVSERKAQDTVIRALPRVTAVYPDVVYVMVGLPTRQPEFQQLADDLGVGDRVVFAGSVAEEALPDYYDLCDLFVLVSRQAADGSVEGYGIVVQEAALCGKPAIVSQGCGLTEAIEEGITGISVPPDDADATAQAICALLSDPVRRQAMGHRALEEAAKATWEQRVAQYDALLQDVIAPQVRSEAQVEAG